MPNQRMSNLQMPNQRMSNLQMPNQRMSNLQMPNQRMLNQQMSKVGKCQKSANTESANVKNLGKFFSRDNVLFLTVENCLKVSCRSPNWHPQQVLIQLSFPPKGP
jgi:hypothetical protein